MQNMGNCENVKYKPIYNAHVLITRISIANIHFILIAKKGKKHISFILFSWFQNSSTSSTATNQQQQSHQKLDWLIETWVWCLTWIPRKSSSVNIDKPIRLNEYFDRIIIESKMADMCTKVIINESWQETNKKS